MRSSRSIWIMLVVVLLVVNFPSSSMVYALDLPSKVNAVAPERARAATLPVEQPVVNAATDATIAATVYITDTGFDPAQVTVQVGDDVVWFNQTSAVQQIAGGSPYRIYLPLVLRNQGSRALITAAPQQVSAPAASAWGSDPIQPGGRYTHTFTTAGDHPYFLSGHPMTTGIVIVTGTSCVPVTDATFISDTPVELGQAMHFTATVTPTNATTPLTHTWDFGTGPTQGNATMAHTFATTGTHAVTLTVDNPCGTASFTDTVTVTAAAVAPDFAIRAWPATQTITRGHSVTVTVALTAVHGFTHAVTLDINGLPSGAAVTWGANPLTPTA